MAAAPSLELRPLGNTGLKLSSVGFGASHLGSVFWPVSEEDAIVSVREAFRLGINFFDTSPYYGGTLSEKMLGKGLKALGVPRNEYIVSTKCGRYTEGFDFSAGRVTRSIDESLERLQLDYVDILHCHDIEFSSLDKIVNETIPALLKLKAAGKTRFIGITGLPLGIFNYVLDRVPPGTVDAILSYCRYSINNTALEDLLPYLKSKGVGVISASPLAMGLLTESGPPDWQPAPPELKAACKAAAAHCKEKGKDISKLSLQFSLSNKDISTILVGMNSAKQVEQNVAAAKELETVGKDDKTLSEIENILKPVKNQTWPSGIQQAKFDKAFAMCEGSGLLPSFSSASVSVSMSSSSSSNTSGGVVSKRMRTSSDLGAYVEAGEVTTWEANVVSRLLYLHSAKKLSFAKTNVAARQLKNKLTALIWLQLSADAQIACIDTWTNGIP